jgi:hypothetical protein
MLSTPTKADAKPPTQADLVRLTGLQAVARLPVGGVYKSVVALENNVHKGISRISGEGH